MKGQYTYRNWRWWAVFPYMLLMLPVALLMQIVVWMIDLATYCTDALWHVRYFLVYDMTKRLTKPLYWVKQERNSGDGG